MGGRPSDRRLNDVVDLVPEVRGVCLERGTIDDAPGVERKVGGEDAPQMVELVLKQFGLGPGKLLP